MKNLPRIRSRSVEIRGRRQQIYFFSFCIRKMKHHGRRRLRKGTYKRKETEITGTERIKLEMGTVEEESRIK